MSLIINFLFLFLLTLLALYLGALYYFRQGLKTVRSRRAQYRPTISIIVSMHNEEQNVRDCIQHLLKQNYSPKYQEIIIVNDRSTDQTAKLLHDMKEKGQKIKVLTIRDSSDSIAPKKYAIDQAIKQADGEIILLTDADGRPGPHWIETTIACFADNVGMVIGYAPYKTEAPYDTFIYRLLALEYLSHAAIACASAGLGYALTCVGTNMAYRKELYEQLDGFGPFKNIHTGDDDLFLQRVREETNWEIVYNSHHQSQVWNAPPRQPKKFFNQRLRYASKGFLYPKKITISLIAYYILNLLIFISPLAVLSHPMYIFPILAVLLFKAIGDYTFLKRAAAVLNDQRHMKLFPFAFMGHIPYVLIFGLLSQIKQFEWGSRKS